MATRPKKCQLQKYFSSQGWQIVGISFGVGVNISINFGIVIESQILSERNKLMNDMRSYNGQMLLQ